MLIIIKYTTMARFTRIILLMIISSYTFGQNYQTEFSKYLQEGDTIKQFEVLTKWEKASPKDAELFTSYFNYFFSKSRKEILVLASGSPTKKEETLILKDSLGQKVGYIGNQINYEKTNLQMAFEKINKGIKLYPNRLDMRFGKIYALGQNKNWKDFTKEIINTIDYSNKINNKWTWTNNKPVENPKVFFLNSIQGYQTQIYNTEDDSLLKNMREISERILKYHPNHVKSLSNISISYLLTGQYEKGLIPLLKAEKIDPKDAIILNNIAQAYKLKGDKKNSIKYYKKTIEFGDNRLKQFAKEQIELLEK